ncbi:MULTISPECIES: hypothetical protein [Subtercola]|uniref:Alkaline shock response membrane anchor protein AmaP n=1 Tax=Subtercola vilae TaxID=2056433 RepID=A0A4T2BQP8_9MICO|nr:MULTISPECIES: hypothetical protein [Subtercola]MEA9986144.1 hypothetical protein [Subtercola sp. RTI3]TIH33570.1 hypothetical protein D4765_14700 [Subtercola vilae]
MNSTNRGANRAVILIAGLVLLVAGAAAVAVGAVPQFRDGWQQRAPEVQKTVTGWLYQTPLGDSGHSWLWIVAAAVALVVSVLLLVFILRQGRGHTRALLSDAPTDDGRTIVEASVAEQLLADGLSGRPELVSSHVSTYSVRGTSVLKVSVSCRRGVSPREAGRMVEQLLLALDALLGSEVPAVVQISGGFRVRTAGSTRLQ